MVVGSYCLRHVDRVYDMRDLGLSLDSSALCTTAMLVRSGEFASRSHPPWPSRLGRTFWPKQFGLTSTIASLGFTMVDTALYKPLAPNHAKLRIAASILSPSTDSLKSTGGWVGKRTLS